MEPSTLLPPDGQSEGFGLRDEALDQLLMTTGYREVTIQYRPTIRIVQDAFNTDKRIRVISLPLDDEREMPWPHLAWIPLWSNLDTCVLVSDPLESPSRHDDDYLLPLGFAQHYAHTVCAFPYYLPKNTPEMFWPRYIECLPIWTNGAQIMCPSVSQNSDDSDATVFSLLLETVLRLRTFIADDLLIEHDFKLGVTYQYITLLFELPLPDSADAAESPYLLSFLLLDAARAVITLGKTDSLTRNGLTEFINHSRSRFNDFDKLIGGWKPKFRFAEQFHELQKHFDTLQLKTLRDPMTTRELLSTLLYKAGILIDEE